MPESRNDTIAAISTPPGRGGVAVVRVSGPAAFAIASRLSGREVAASLAGRFFHCRLAFANRILDDGLVLVFAAPHSYTGEDVVEFHVHGGSVPPRRVLEAAVAMGARNARRGEFTERAFLNGKLDLSEAEAVIDLIDARTARAADDAMKRLGGCQQREFERLYAEALALSAEVEHALDFSEDELPPAFYDRVASRARQLEAALKSARATADEGRILREGALVVLAGAPNAGKSSLMNALLQENRAIVSAVAGTTRDSIEEGLDLDGWPIRLTDTAGLRAADDQIEAAGVSRSEALIAQAEVVLALSEDGVFPPTPDASRTIRVHSKCDLASAQPVEGLAVSAKTGAGLKELKAAIAAKLAELAGTGRAREDGATVNARQKELLDRALAAQARAQSALSVDFVLAANDLRDAAAALGELVGKTYSADLLEAIFSRFCVGK